MTGAHAAETVNDGDLSMATYKETVVCEARCCACPEGGFVRTTSNPPPYGPVSITRPSPSLVLKATNAGVGMRLSRFYILNKPLGKS